MAKLSWPTTAVALFRLHMRRSVASWMSNLFYAFMLPLIVYLLVRSAAAAEQSKPILMTGTILNAAILVNIRHLTRQMNRDRATGAFALLATCGVTRTHYIAARLLDVAGLAILPLAAGAAIVVFDSSAFMGLTKWWLHYSLFVAALAGISGCLVAFLRPPLTGLAANLTTVLFFALCPLYYPATRVPDMFSGVVRWLPPALAAEGMRVGDGSVESAVALAVWVFVSWGLAGVRFPWTNS